MQPKARNYTIDLVRLIASFFVIALHVSLGVTDEDTLAPIRIACRWAVPFFFMVSGYFYQVRFEKDPRKAVTNTCSRLLKVFVVTSLIYWPLAYYQTGHIFEFDYLRNGTHLHLWFLSSMIVGFVVLYTLSLLNLSDNLILGVCLLIIAFTLLHDSYANIVPGFSGPMYSHKRVLLSIPFLFLGMYFKKKERLWENYITWQTGLFLLIAGYGLQLLEMHFIHERSGYSVVRHEFLIGTLLMSIGIFTLALTIHTRSSRLNKWGEAYSLLIYLYHPLLVYLLAGIIDYLHIDIYSLPLVIPPIIFVLTLSLVSMVHTYLPGIYNILSGSFTLPLENRVLQGKRVS